ncbi:MAG: hypothetical protein Tsb0019_15820 [Roseibium sp.]
MITLEEVNQIPSPPSPKNPDDVVPPITQPAVLFNNLDLKDVIADPLYAYIKETDTRYVNFDRRNLRLQVKAQWVSVGAAQPVPGVTVIKKETIREGISSSTTVAEMFATSIGVKTGVSTPVVDLGADISTTLTQSTSQTFEINSETETSTTFEITSTGVKSSVWIWQLKREFLLTLDEVTWAVTSDKGIKQLTGSDGEDVLTRDGQGRQRRNLKQVSGAKPELAKRVQQMLPANSDVYVFTASPSTDDILTLMAPTDNSGSKTVIPTFDDLMASVRSGTLEEEAA